MDHQDQVLEAMEATTEHHHHHLRILNLRQLHVQALLQPVALKVDQAVPQAVKVPMMDLRLVDKTETRARRTATTRTTSQKIRKKKVQAPTMTDSENGGTSRNAG